MFGHFGDGRVVVGAKHNSINPALEIPRDIANFLARRNARAALVHEQRGSTERCHAGLKRDTRTQ